jgi:hypothetical protein
MTSSAMCTSALALMRLDSGSRSHVRAPFRGEASAPVGR